MFCKETFKLPSLQDFAFISKTHHQNEEHKEDVTKEENRSQNTISSFQFIKVKVSQDESKECESVEEERITTCD